MIVIVVAVCCCFMRIDQSAPHSYEIEAERRVHEAKISEEFDDDFNNLELQQNGRSTLGLDNHGFNGDEDAISSYTATTILSESNESSKPKSNNKNRKIRNKIRTNPHIKNKTSQKISKKKVRTDEDTVDYDENTNSHSSERVKPDDETSIDTIIPQSAAENSNEESNGDGKDSCTIVNKTLSCDQDNHTFAHEIENDRDSKNSRMCHQTHPDHKKYPSECDHIEDLDCNSGCEKDPKPAHIRCIERVKTDDETSIDTTVPLDNVENINEESDFENSPNSTSKAITFEACDRKE